MQLDFQKMHGLGNDFAVLTAVTVVLNLPPIKSNAYPTAISVSVSIKCW